MRVIHNTCFIAIEVYVSFRRWKITRRKRPLGYRGLFLPGSNIVLY